MSILAIYGQTDRGSGQDRRVEIQRLAQVVGAFAYLFLESAPLELLQGLIPPGPHQQRSGHGDYARHRRQHPRADHPGQGMPAPQNRGLRHGQAQRQRQALDRAAGTDKLRGIGAGRLDRAQQALIEGKGGQHGAIGPLQPEARLRWQVQGPVESDEVVQIDGGHDHAAKIAVRRMQPTRKTDHPIGVDPVAQRVGNKQVIRVGVALDAEVLPVG